MPIDEVDWPDRAALLFGAEGPGLSDAWLAAADQRVRIPMQPGADSLNVATAAAIAFYARPLIRVDDSSEESPNGSRSARRWRSSA